MTDAELIYSLRNTGAYLFPKKADSLMEEAAKRLEELAPPAPVAPENCGCCHRIDCEQCWGTKRCAKHSPQSPGGGHGKG